MYVDSVSPVFPVKESFKSPNRLNITCVKVDLAAVIELSCGRQSDLDVVFIVNLMSMVSLRIKGVNKQLPVEVSISMVRRCH